MNMRRLYTLCLLTVYLFSVAGAACAALTCPCLAGRAHEKRHVCDADCQLRHDVRAHGTAFTADCCGSHLNGDAELYTSAASGHEKQLRRAVSAPEMQPALLSAVAVFVPTLPGAAYLRVRPVLFRSDPPVLHAGLRAPPAVA